MTGEPSDPTRTDPLEDGLTAADLTAADVRWQLDPLLGGTTVEQLLDEADVLVDELAGARGSIAWLDSAGLASLMHRSAELEELLGRLGNYVLLRFSENTADPERGAQMMAVQERTTAMATKLVFFELEWAALDDERVGELLSDPALDFCAHHLRNLRRYRDHLLSEPEEQLLTEKSVSGASAWVRLFDELTSAITVDLPGTVLGQAETPSVTAGLEVGLSLLQHTEHPFVPPIGRHTSCSFRITRSSSTTSFGSRRSGRTKTSHSSRHTSIRCTSHQRPFANTWSRNVALHAGFDPGSPSTSHALYEGTSRISLRNGRFSNRPWIIASAPSKIRPGSSRAPSRPQKPKCAYCWTGFLA